MGRVKKSKNAAPQVEPEVTRHLTTVLAIVGFIAMYTVTFGVSLTPLSVIAPCCVIYAGYKLPAVVAQLQRPKFVGFVRQLVPRMSITGTRKKTNKKKKKPEVRAIQIHSEVEKEDSDSSFEVSTTEPNTPKESPSNSCKSDTSEFKEELELKEIDKSRESKEEWTKRSDGEIEKARELSVDPNGMVDAAVIRKKHAEPLARRSREEKKELNMRRTEHKEMGTKPRKPIRRELCWYFCWGKPCSHYNNSYCHYSHDEVLLAAWREQYAANNKRFSRENKKDIRSKRSPPGLVEPEAITLRDETAEDTNKNAVSRFIARAYSEEANLLQKWGISLDQGLPVLTSATSTMRELVSTHFEPTRPGRELEDLKQFLKYDAESQGFVKEPADVVVVPCIRFQ